jgi:hypothetical protein
VDYPHADTTWPLTPEILWRDMKDFPEEEIHKITHRNAMRFFAFDPFKVINPKDATVGALRAEARDVDVSPKSYSGKVPEKLGKVLTNGDLARLVSSMEETLGEPIGTLE